MSDHYQTLGVSKTATQDEIKNAFRKLASKHHPDKGGDTATFQKIEEAYRILGDPEKRTEYDNPRSEHNPFNHGGFGPGGMFHGINPEDIFSQIFGQRAGNPFNNQSRQRQVFRTNFAVSLEDAYTGSSQILKIQTPTGEKVINVEIPRGVNNNSHIRYDNIIDNGTLIVEFRVLPHLRFERRDNDLYANHSISVLDLIVGSTFSFVTISGKEVEVKVPPNTQPYMQLKLPKQGMPAQNTDFYGDQIILLKPYIEDKIDDEVIQSILRFKSKSKSK